MPCKFVFKMVEGGEYMAMYKHGDDLRQDNLILQIITLMDKVFVILILWNHNCLWKINIHGFHALPLSPRPHKRLTK